MATIPMAQTRGSEPGAVIAELQCTVVAPQAERDAELAQKAAFAEGLNPGPADLKEIAGERAAREIFWVIKNGIRMTGMPGFAAAGVDDEEAWASRPS